MLQRSSTDAAGSRWLDLDELQAQIGYALPLRCSDAPFVRHAAIDAVQLQSLLAAHDTTADSASMPSSQATAPLSAAPVTATAATAPCAEGACNLGSALKCMHFSRYEVETEWAASVAAEERVYNQQQAATASGTAPARFSDSMVHTLLHRWCIGLQPQPGLQAERAKLQATFDADRTAKTTAVVKQPLHLAASASPATPSRAESTSGLGLPNSASKTKSFSPGASLANVLLNLGPTSGTAAPAAAASPPSAAAASKPSTKSLNPLHSLARTASNSSSSLLSSPAATAAAAAVSPNSAVASRALLGIGAATAVPPPEPAKTKRGAAAAGTVMHPPEKKARVEAKTPQSPPKPRGSRKSTTADASASPSGSILQLAALAEQQAV